jgi:hypothetical protein
MQAAGMKTPETLGQPDANLKELDLSGLLAELMVGWKKRNDKQKD